jgi:putative DNA primase/helicase
MSSPGDPAAPVTVRPVDALEERETELGLARRFVRLIGSNFRFVPATRTWLAWVETHWARAQGGEVERAAKYVVDSLFIEVMSEPDPDRKRVRAKFALAAQSARAIRNMLTLAETELEIALPPDALDRDGWLLNFQNGTLELRGTPRLRPHRREDLITKCLPVRYEPGAACPIFLAFLERIFEGNRDLIRFVQRAVGYSLVGAIFDQIILFCWGTGANGKSTLLHALAKLLGDYAATLAAETLLARKADPALAMNDLSTLQGARFVIAVESDMGRRLAEARVKQLTSVEPIKVKRLFADVYTIAPTFKIWIASNHKPRITGTDEAIWRRVKLIPFAVGIPDAEQDPTLGAKLEAEREGILAWAVQGCLDWQREGLAAPEKIREATAAYREQMDSMASFLAERCSVDTGATVTATELYDAFLDWSKRSGETPPPKQTFGLLLQERGFTSTRTNRSRKWLGLRVLTPLDDP